MTRNLLVISDLHLGIPGLTDISSADAERADRMVVGFLDAHAHQRPEGRAWRLVINGDLFEFLRAAPPTDSSLDRWEDAHPGPIVRVLDQIVAAHRELFAGLARFALAGNDLVILRGNHDAEICIPEVVRRLEEHLLEAADLDGPVERAEFLEHVRVEPEAYHEAGRIHVEHGHMYDPFCAWQEEEEGYTATRDMPASARVIRDVVNRFGGFNLFRMERWGTLRTVGWFLAKSPWRLLLLFPWMYLKVVGRLLRAWAHAREDRKRCRRPKRNRWSRLWARPGYASLSQVAGFVHLDRLLLFALTLGLAFSTWSTSPLLAAVAALLVFALGCRLLRRPFARYNILEVARHLRTKAFRVGRELEVPLVVFGHTHYPGVAEQGGVTYGNLGCWLADGEAPEDGPSVFNAFTYLRVLRREDGDEVKLLRWAGREGPLPFVALESW